MAKSSLDLFRQAILSDESLQAQLREIAGWPSFVAAALRLAADRGLAITAADLEAAAREGRRVWMERHL
jgi:hypothetical protein